MAKPLKGYIMRLKSGALVPDDKLCEPDIFKGNKEGDYIIVSFHKPRNVQHHRKFFALINVVFPHQETWATIDTFREALLVAAGYSEPVEAMVDIEKINENGEIIVTGKVKGIYHKAKSINFATLDQAAFEQVYNACVRVILTRILPVSEKELEAQVLEIMNGRKA